MKAGEVVTVTVEAVAAVVTGPGVNWQLVLELWGLRSWIWSISIWYLYNRILSCKSVSSGTWNVTNPQLPTEQGSPSAINLESQEVLLALELV